MNSPNPSKPTSRIKLSLRQMTDSFRAGWQKLPGGRFGRWPWLSAAAVILLLAAFTLGRRIRSANGAETTTDVERTTATDSVVTLDSTSLRLAGIEIANAAPTTASDLLANGTITYDANKVSVIASRAEGRVVSVLTDLGRSVVAGQTMAVLESPEVGGTRGDLGKAQAALETARQNYEREKRLYEQQITPQKELLEAEGSYRSAIADHDAAVARLRALGGMTGQGGQYALTTPLAGIVVVRNASPGQIVGPTTNLFTVADLKRVWITVDVYESDLPRVRQGAAVDVAPRALPGETFRGYVTYAGGIVDTTSRTIKVRVDIENPALRLRPGMFAQVKIAGPVGQATGSTGVVVPELAVQDLNGRSVVFVPENAPGKFVARAVTTGAAPAPDMITILAGLQPGERFVAKGSFQLKSELQKASFGDDDK